jgi:hypothetical protein
LRTAYREFVSIFDPQNGIRSCVIFPLNGSERNPESLLLFLVHGIEQNSKLISLPLKGLEQNYESLLLFLFHKTEFKVVSLPQKGSEQNSDNFLLHGTARIQSEIAICFVFRRFIFLSKIPNPISK